MSLASSAPVWDLPPPLWHPTPAGWTLDIRRCILVDHKERRVAHLGGAPALKTASTLPQPVSHPATLVPAVDDATHRARISTIQEHIRRGDIYQANLTRPLACAGLPMSCGHASCSAYPQPRTPRCLRPFGYGTNTFQFHGDPSSFSTLGEGLHAASPSKVRIQAPHTAHN